MSADQAGPSALATAAGLLDGRAAVTFVVLAGVGSSLMTRGDSKSSGSAPELAPGARWNLLKLALFLFAIGLAYTPIWPADILHFYGVYTAFAAPFLGLSSRALLGIAGALVLAFPLLLVFVDYEWGRDWETLTYSGLWTAQGMARHLFFNGFHPAIPWAAFLFLGIALGRLDMRNRAVRKRVLIVAGCAVVFFEGLSQALFRVASRVI